MTRSSFTEGGILKPLLMFTIPVIAAMFLQSLYGAVDLMIVGHFAKSLDVSAVSTGAQIMMTVTGVVTGLAMGTTILLGQLIGEGKDQDTGKAVGAAIFFFAIISILLSIVMFIGAEKISAMMNAPQEAFAQTCSYIRICSAGLIFITAYNVLGSLFRGIGNSQIPLLAVAIAAVINMAADYIAVKMLGMGTAGAACATVLSQAISVAVSLLIIRRIDLPFVLHREDIRANGKMIRRIVGFGAPLALADLLVGFSFLIILSIVNSLGLLASAGVGVAEKVCGFIMLIPSAFSQAMASFVAQNYGARKMKRALKGLCYGIAVSFAIGVVMSYFSFFHGDLLCNIFTKDADVAMQGWEYLKAYAIDTLLVSFLFCLMGFFNGCGFTTFSMAQNLISAFLVRIPVSWLMSKQVPVSLFKVGLAVPVSSFASVVMCGCYLVYLYRKGRLDLGN